MLKTRQKRWSLAFILLFVTGLGLSALASGCNTVEGVGEDIEATGDALEGAADDDAE